MADFLVPEENPRHEHRDNPYEKQGAWRIVKRFRPDVLEMLKDMKENAEKFQSGKTFLSQSPLRDKVFVAGAMKTLGWVEERPTDNGTCALVLTPKSRQFIRNNIGVIRCR